MATLKEDDDVETDDGEPRARVAGAPGLVLCFSGETPRHLPLRQGGGAIELGRDRLLALGIDDPRVSQPHAAVEHAAGRWTVRDLGSTNGTFLDGARLGRPWTGTAPRVLRLGRTLCLFSDDLEPHLRLGLRVDETLVAGPTLATARARVVELAAASQHVLFTGETGAGKELMARASPTRRPAARAARSSP